jgi:hypothetical protein
MLLGSLAERKEISSVTKSLMEESEGSPSKISKI